MLTFLYFLTITLFLLLCVLICGVILMQESKSSGLGASFGGETADSLFGTATAEILKSFTAVLGVIFLVACVVLSIWTSAIGKTEKAGVLDNFPSEFTENTDG